MKNLLLITGAGASHGVTDTPEANLKFKPPLTKHLFNSNFASKENHYIADCLKNNPLAHQAGDVFRNRLNSGQEDSLEGYLTKLKNSKELPRLRQYWAIPIYLYELFNSVSYSYLPTSYGLPSNYKELIDAINGSKYDQLIWLNLNYDLLADQAIRISIKNKLTNFKLEDYTQLETEDGKLKIKYTKPHGSVDWFYKILIPGVDWQQIKIGLETIPVDFPNKLSEEICMGYGLPSGVFPQQYYPALTAPIGKDYGFIYDKHIQDIIPDLKNTQDVLCIGFSAFDEDILKLIKNVPQIVKLKIVNEDRKSGREAFGRIQAYHQDIWASVESAEFDGGFSQFIGKELQRWLSRDERVVS